MNAADERDYVEEAANRQHLEDDGRREAEAQSAADRRRADVMAEILAERWAQDQAWGEQNHPDGTGPSVLVHFPYGTARYAADRARERCKRSAANGTVTWLDVLTEEFHEALAEDNPAKLRAELIQVAAVAAAWVEAIDRRSAK